MAIASEKGPGQREQAGKWEAYQSREGARLALGDAAAFSAGLQLAVG